MYLPLNERVRRQLGSSLVLFIKVVFSFSISSLCTDLFVVLLEGSEILAGLGEFTFFHTFSDIPVDKGTLGIHQVELVVNTGQGLSNSSSVGNHAHSALDTSQVASRNDSGWLVVDTTFKACRAPVSVIVEFEDICVRRR